MDLEDYPPCPACDSNLFVAGYAGSEPWVCHRCDRPFRT